MHHESCNQGYYQSKMGVVLRCPGFPYSVRSLLMYFEPGISPISGHYLPCSPFDLSQIFDTRVRWELAFLFLVEGLLIVKQSSALKKKLQMPRFRGGKNYCNSAAVADFRRVRHPGRRDVEYRAAQKREVCVSGRRLDLTSFEFLKSRRNAITKRGKIFIL